MTDTPLRLPCAQCGSFRIDEVRLAPHEWLFALVSRHKRYRCRRCGWTGWMKPSSYRRRRRSGQTVMGPLSPEKAEAPLDLNALDAALAREDARPIAPWKSGARHGDRRSRHGRA